MKYLTLFAALLLCSNAQAATYVYQANAYQGHGGRCGGVLVPFQLTVTVKKVLPPNSNLIVPVETVSLNAGGKYQWERSYKKKDGYEDGFTTDSNGDIVAWTVTAGESHRTYVVTQNETAPKRTLTSLRQ